MLPHNSTYFCSRLKGRRPFWLLNPPARGVPRDGWSRWSVAGGDDGELLWMQGRLFQLWQCVRDQTGQIVKIAPPLHILFLFLYFFYFFLILFF